jgi:peroxiredoxin
MKLIASLVLLITFSVIAFGQQTVGTEAHNFTKTTINGEEIELEKLKGKVVVLTFWSTRCEICVAEMPKLNNLVSKYENQDVVFLGVTLNNQAMVEKFLKKKSFNFKIITNGFGVLLKYADRDSQDRLNMGYPAHFIIDQQGKVILKMIGFKKSEKIDQTVGKLLTAE